MPKDMLNIGADFGPCRIPVLNVLGHWLALRFFTMDVGEKPVGFEPEFILFGAVGGIRPDFS